MWKVTMAAVMLIVFGGLGWLLWMNIKVIEEQED